MQEFIIIINSLAMIVAAIFFDLTIFIDRCLFAN